MAGNWIKFDTSTPDKPEVWAIAEHLGIDPDAVVGKLLRVWTWFDDHSEKGNAPTVTKALLDRRVGVTGFVSAMVNAGWMLETDGVLCLPNFDRHNGETAKTRALTAKRVANHKKSNAEGNAKGNGESVSRALPREEKNRIEKNREEEEKTARDVSRAQKISEVLDCWNSSESTAKVRKLTKDRRVKLSARLEDCDWPWEDAIAKLPIPNTDRFTWQPDFDWLIANDRNAYSLAEGKYDLKNEIQPQPKPRVMA